MAENGLVMTLTCEKGTLLLPVCHMAKRYSVHWDGSMIIIKKDEK
jgi:hypothetical protein